MTGRDEAGVPASKPTCLATLEVPNQRSRVQMTRNGGLQEAGRTSRLSAQDCEKVNGDGAGPSWEGLGLGGFGQSSWKD